MDVHASRDNKKIIEDIEAKIRGICSNTFTYELKMPRSYNLNKSNFNISLVTLLVSYLIYKTSDVIQDICDIYMSHDDSNFKYIKINYIDVITLYIDARKSMLSICKKTMEHNIKNINNNITKTEKKVDMYNECMVQYREAYLKLIDERNAILELLKNISSREERQQVGEKIRLLYDESQHVILKGNNCDNEKKNLKELIREKSMAELKLKQYENNDFSDCEELLKKLQTYVESKRKSFTSDELMFIDYLARYILWIFESELNSNYGFIGTNIGYELENQLYDKIVEGNDEFRKYVFKNVFIEDNLEGNIKGEFDIVLGELENNNIKIHKIYDIKNTGNAITHDVELFENAINHITSKPVSLKINKHNYIHDGRDVIQKGYMINIPFNTFKFVNNEINKCIIEYISFNMETMSNKYIMQILKSIYYDPTVKDEYKFITRIHMFNNKCFASFYESYFTKLRRQMKILKNYDIRYCEVDM